MISNVYKYPIFDNESKIVDTLEVNFLCNEKTGYKIKVSIKNQNGEILSRENLTINKINAIYLKGWNNKVFWPQDARGKKQNEKYFLKFNNANVTITIFWHFNHQKIEASIPQVCTPKGLSEFAKEKVPLNSFQLFFQEKTLVNNMSLEEQGITDGSLIEVVTPDEINSTASSLQMGTGSSLNSVSCFEKYIRQIQEKIGIICQIFFPPNSYGTGFMIGDYLIMTNHHVIKEGAGGVAKFFYHDSIEDSFEIGLDENVVCCSESPNRKFPSKKRLDYAILRLMPKKDLTERQWTILLKLNKMGKEFFDNGEKNFENLQKRHLERVEMVRTNNIHNLHPPRCNGINKNANIIQHPLDENKKPQPKQIAFRDNAVHASDFFLLHYRSPTSGGSSGAPVIDDLGNWLGIHYSSCIKIEKKLIKKHQTVCDKLGYKHVETTLTYIHYKNEQEHLYIFCSKNNEGMCAKDSEGEQKTTLLELIINHHQKLLLSELVGASYLEHVYCNTAIHTVHILDDLQKNWAQHLKDTRSKTNQEWNKSRDSFIQKSWLILTGKVTLLAFGVFCLYKISKKFNQK